MSGSALDALIVPGRPMPPMNPASQAAFARLLHGHRDGDPIRLATTHWNGAELDAGGRPTLEHLNFLYPRSRISIGLEGRATACGFMPHVR